MKKKKNNKKKTGNMVMNISGFNREGGRGVLFPERLRANFRLAYNSIFTFNGGANSYNVISLSNGISMIPSQNLSGLYWLLSGQQNNGSSYAPYSLAVIRRVQVNVYAKVVAQPSGNASVLLTVYPLAYGNSSSGLTITNAEEQFGRSSIIELPLVFDTVAHRKPMISKKYNVWDLIGISESTYMNSLDEHSFNYAGMLGTATAQYICLQAGTENATADATLNVRYNIEMEVEIEFYARNGANINSPHS
jgi:hypothetical protein